LASNLDSTSDLEIGTLVRIDDAIDRQEYLGEILRGPFFPSPSRPDDRPQLRYDCRLIGRLDGSSVESTVGRPRPGSPVLIVEQSDGLDLRFLLPTEGNLLLGSLRRPGSIRFT
jgi:hypothetical protein